MLHSHLLRRRVTVTALVDDITTAPSLRLARVASLPRVASAALAACLRYLSIVSALHTTAALTGWLFDQLVSTFCVAHCPPPSQASHASHPSRPRARQLGVGRHHLQPRAYDLCRHLQRHHPVRSVAPRTVYHAPTRGIFTCGRGWESGAGGGQRAASRRSGGVGWWRRVGARHTAHLPPAADLMPPRAPLLTPPPAPAPLSQGPWRKEPGRQRAHAARATHLPDDTVSRRTSPPPPPPSRGTG